MLRFASAEPCFAALCQCNEMLCFAVALVCHAMPTQTLSCPAVPVPSNASRYIACAVRIGAVPYLALPVRCPRRTSHCRCVASHRYANAFASLATAVPTMLCPRQAWLCLAGALHCCAALCPCFAARGFAVASLCHALPLRYSSTPCRCHVMLRHCLACLRYAGALLCIPLPVRSAVVRCRCGAVYAMPTRCLPMLRVALPLLSLSMPKHCCAIRCYAGAVQCGALRSYAFAVHSTLCRCAAALRLACAMHA